MSQLLVTLIVTFFVIQMAVFSTTIYLHRAATHRALILHPALAFAFRFALWLTTGLSTREWVAVHRKHHAHTDQEGDPHSPYLEGFWPVQLGNIFYYIREKREAGIVPKYARDIKEDVWDRWIFNHGFVGLGIGIALLCLFLGPGWGLLAAGLHAFIYIFVLSSSINGLCH
ncbi:MAG: fatty acid desaturase, partial [Acidimicrobiia bacterium]